MKTRGKPYRLPGAFTKSAPTDSPELSDLWTRHASDPTAQTFNALWEAYLGLVVKTAGHMAHSTPELYGDVDAAISDGCLGLMSALQRCRRQHPVPFFFFATRVIRSAIRDGASSRLFGGRRAQRKDKILGDIRSRLLQRLGRMPDRQEIESELAGRLKNKFLYFGDQDFTRHHMSTAPPENLRRLSPAADDDQSPDAGLLGREVVNLALKGLDPIDAKILRRLLKGQCPAEIAKAMGYSAPHLSKRLAGVIWETRCRADLAAYLGVEPATGPRPKLRGGKGQTADKLPPAPIRRRATA